MGTKKVKIVPADNPEPVAQTEAPKQTISAPVPSTSHKSAEQVIVLRRGEVWVVPVTADGVEVPADGFKVDQKTYDRFYSKNDRFILKKKAQ